MVKSCIVFVFFLLLLLNNSVLLAQEVKDTTQIKKIYKNSFTFRGGVNIAYRKYHSDNMSSIDNEYFNKIEKPGLGYDVGVEYSRRINKLLSYSVGFRFNKFCYDLNDNDRNLHYKYLHELVGVPISIAVHFTKNRSWYSSLYAQPSYVTKVVEDRNEGKYYNLSVVDMTLENEVILMGGLTVGKQVLNLNRFSISVDLSFFHTSIIQVDPEANGVSYYNGAYDRALYGASLSLLLSPKF